ncbi:MAG: acyl carrier protein [Marinilabiliaceae bacterium]|nr:acyl carrier protein [Marinilabiliaceae bacterium]
MKKSDFLNELHEFLEIESVESFNVNTNLINLDEYDSLAIMSIVAFIDEKFSSKLTSNQLAGIVTIKDLIELVGNEKFED